MGGDPELSKIVDARSRLKQISKNSKQMLYYVATSTVDWYYSQKQDC